MKFQNKGKRNPDSLKFFTDKQAHMRKNKKQIFGTWWQESF